MFFDAGDDAICLKSGKDEDGRRRGEPCENVIIKNNTVLHGHGGFVIGSEMSGGVRNVYVSGCSFVGTDVGLRFKSTRGRGGVVENIFIDNINMIDISNDALTMDLYYAVNDFPETPIPDVNEETPVSGTFIFQMFFAEVRNGQYISTGCRKCLLRISLSKHDCN